MMHLTSPKRSTHGRRVTPYKKKMMKKLEDIDSSEFLPEKEEAAGERSLSHLDFDVHKPQQDDACGSCAFPDSFSTVKTAPMGDNEWYGGGGYGESSEEDDDDVQSFANCSPVPSGRSSLPRGEWLADLMINKDMNDPAYATKWVYAPDGSSQHLELDIRLLQNSTRTTSPTSSSSSPRGGVTTLSHLIGSNPMHLSSSSIFDFKRRIQKMPRRFSTTH